MNVNELIGNTTKLLKANAPEILTALGISGVITTAYLTAKATFKAAEEINHEQWMLDKEEKSHPLDTKEKAALVWKLYIPAAASGVVTIACLVGANHSSGRRTAAAVTAYSLTEKAFGEYKEKVVEQIGKGKEQKVRDEIAQDRINANPNTKEVIVLSGGDVLCLELYTHRYFRSDVETLRKAENTINSLIVNYLNVTLEEFYDIVGLPHTSQSGLVGWDSDKLMELQFSPALAEDGTPCMAFEYNYVKPLK